MRFLQAGQACAEWCDCVLDSCSIHRNMVLAVWLADLWSLRSCFFGRAGFFGLCAALRESAAVDVRLCVCVPRCACAQEMGLLSATAETGLLALKVLACLSVTGCIAAVCEMFVFQLVHRTLQLPLCAGRLLAGRWLFFLPPPIPTLGKRLQFMGPPCVQKLVRPSVRV